jgi:hypothetical protein
MEGQIKREVFRKQEEAEIILRKLLFSVCACW